jgi:hypothetical protein
VALQDHGDVLPERALDAHAFVEVKGHAFIRMVADALIKLGADLLSCSSPSAQAATAIPGSVGVDHAVGVFPPYAPRCGW